jgi:hypothetical protein
MPRIPIGLTSGLTTGVTTGRLTTGVTTGRLTTGVATGGLSAGVATGAATGVSFADSVRSDALTRVSAVAIRDNTKFVETFDNSKIVDIFRPTRTLVVGQIPGAGTFVPVGTPVDLTLTVKNTLPLDGFKEIDPKVLTKFAGKNVGDLTSSYSGTAAEKVLEREDAGDYDQLSTSDKAVVNDYIKATYGVDAATDAAGAKNVYGSVKFLNDL